MTEPGESCCLSPDPGPDDGTHEIQDPRAMLTAAAFGARSQQHVPRRMPRGSRASMTRAVLSATEPPCAFTIASALRYEDVLLVGTKDEQACLTASVKGLAKPRPGGGGADGGGSGGKTRRASATALRKSPYASAAGNATRARADVAANAAATATADGGATARVTRVNGEGLKGMGILDAAESLWEWIQYRVRLMPTRLVLDFVRDGW